MLIEELRAPQKVTKLKIMSYIFLKFSSVTIFNFNFNFKTRSSNGKSKRRRLGWHPHAQLKPNPEPSGFGPWYLRTTR